MSNRLKMTPAKQFNAAQFDDPKRLNAYMQQRYGLPAQDVEQALKLNTALAAGRMPDQAQFKWVCDAAKTKYGWNPDRVRSELNQCLQHPTPEGRITAYLHAGGNRVAPEMVREVIGMVEAYSHAEMEQTVLDRVSQSPGEQYFNKRENNLPVNQRAKDAADGRTDIRNALKAQLQDSDAVTYGEARQRVHRAGLRLVDRINASEAQDMLDRANGREPQGKSLRDELSMAYDVEKVGGAMEAYGFGSFEDAISSSREETAHLDDRFDVTEEIRDL